MNLINKQFKSHYDKRIKKICEDYEVRLNDAFLQYKFALNSLAERHKKEDELKDENHKKELETIRQQEREIYLGKIAEREQEIARLRGIIDERKQYYQMVKNKEGALQELAVEIGGKLEQAKVKNGEAIQLVNQALASAETYENEQIKLNKNISKIGEEI
jgi:hypothetical protein